MNAHVKPTDTSPLAVTDPRIRKELQLAGLRFMCSSAQWLKAEAIKLGTALKSGAMTSDEVDAELAEMGALDLAYPMAAAEYEWRNIYQCWEAEDLGRSKPPNPPKQEYRTRQATEDAFFGWIVRQDEATQGRWLADHPRDAEYLRKLWEHKCKPQSK